MKLFHPLLALLYISSSSVISRSEDLGTTPDDVCEPRSLNYDALACWLSLLQIDLPSETFQEGILKLSIKGLQCSQFSVDGLSSTSSTVSTGSVIDLRVKQLSAICTGHYACAGMGGDLVATVLGQQQQQLETNDGDGGEPALEWSLAIQSSTSNAAQLPMPDAVETTTCATTLKVIDLQFSGSISAKIVDLFHTKIADYVTTQINLLVCPNLQNQVDPWLTSTLKQVETWLDPYLNTSSSSGNNSTTDSSYSDSDAAWVDFSKDSPVLTGLLSAWNDWALNFIDRGLLQHVFPSTPPLEHCGAGFDGLNGLLTSLLSDGDNGGSRFNLPIPAVLQPIQFDIPHVGHVEINFQSIYLTGVSHWRELQVLRPLQQREFKTRLASALPVQLDLDLIVNVSTPLVGGGGFFFAMAGNRSELVERMHVQINASSLDVQTTFELDMRRSSWNVLAMNTIIDVIHGIVDPLFDASHAVNCLLGGVDGLQASHLFARIQLSGASVVPWRKQKQQQLIQGELEQDVDQLVNVVAQLVLKDYQPYISKALLGLSQGPLRDVINDALRGLIQTYDKPPEKSDCSSSSDSPFPFMVNFSNIAALRQLNDLLVQPSTLDHVNAYIDCVVKFLTRALKEELRHIFGRANDNDDLVTIRQLEILNAGSLRHTHIISPGRDGMYLSNGLEYGTVNKTTEEGEELVPQLLVGLDVTYAPLNLSASVNVILSVNDIECGSGLILHYDLNGLKQLPISQIAAHDECIVAPATSWDLIDTLGHLGYISMTLNASGSAGTMAKPVTISIDSQDHPSISDMAMSFFSWMSYTLHDLVLSFTSAIFSRAERECGDQRGRHPSDDDFESSNLTSILVIMAAILLLAQPSVMLIQRIPQRSDEVASEREFLRPLLQDDPDAALYDDPGFENQGSSSKSLKDSYPGVVAYAIVVAILSTIALLLSGHLSVVSSVDISLILGGRSMSFPSVFEFSPQKVNEFTHSGIYPLFILVGLLSGLWSYAKLLMMLYAWFSRHLSTHRRGRLLTTIDSLGKFGFAEIYVVCLTIVVFRYHLQVDTDHLVDAFLSPKFGLYGFWMGSIASTVLGHVLIYLHRKAVLGAVGVLPSTPRSGSVLTHGFLVSSGSKRHLSLPFYVFLLFLFILVIDFLVLGISREIFVLDIEGLAGLALQAKSRSAYSLLSLGSLLPVSVSNPWSLGIVGLTIFFFVSMVVMPFASLVFLSLLLLLPCSLERQLRLLTCAETANAWSSIEVVALSVIAAILQFPSLVDLFVHKRCNWIQALYTDESIACYGIRYSMQLDIIYLIVGVFLNSFLVCLVLRLSRQATSERIEQESVQHQRRDQLSSHDLQDDRPNIMQCFAQYRCTSWILAPPNDYYLIQAPDLDSNTAPPLEGSMKEPWENNESFDDEWKGAAERDPSWKEWREATNVT